MSSVDKGKEKTLCPVFKHEEEVHPGDVFFLWKSGRHAGLYGWGEVLEPGIIDRREIPGKISKNFKAKFVVYVKNIEEFDQFIPVATVQKDKELSNHIIFNQPGGTNYSLTTSEVNALTQVIKNENLIPPTPKTQGVRISLEILEDEPIKSSSDDRLSFEPATVAITGLIDNPKPEVPLTTAINVPWNAGKSSLGHLIRIREKLSGKPAAGGSAPHVTMWFDAWNHEDPTSAQ